MCSDLIVLDSVDAIERVIVASEERLVLLFKHSVTCGTSAQVHDEIVAHLSKDERGAHYAIVTVQTHQNVSDVVTTRFNVRDETPQALLIQDGRVVAKVTNFA